MTKTHPPLFHLPKIQWLNIHREWSWRRIVVTCKPQRPKPEPTKVESGTATRTPFAASTVCRKALTTSLAPFRLPVALSLSDTSISPALRHISTHLRQDAGHRARLYCPSAVHGRRSCCRDQQAAPRCREFCRPPTHGEIACTDSFCRFSTRTSSRSGRRLLLARRSSRAASRGTQVLRLSSWSAMSTIASSTSSRCSSDTGRSMPISSSRLAAPRRLRWYASQLQLFCEHQADRE
jgi:hypothetical protein